MNRKEFLKTVKTYHSTEEIPAYGECEAMTDGTAVVDYKLRHKIGKSLFDVLPAFQLRGEVFAPSAELERVVWLAEVID